MVIKDKEGGRTKRGITEVTEEAVKMNIKTSMVDFPSNGRTMPGYLARPDSEGGHPALVVIQEWWGLVPHIKEVADRFAAEGYVALAPDLYYGQEASEPDEARKLAMALDRDRAVAEIGAAAGYLKALSSVNSEKVGVVGWCMGGGLSLSAAAEDGDIGAAVCFYGRPLSEADTARLEVPVLGLFAGEDHGISVAEVRTFEKELERHGVPHEIHLYENAHHAFFNNTRPVYDPEVAGDAWLRTLDWFQTYLDA
jgi:carboxymethylenebutenolidase